MKSILETKKNQRAKAVCYYSCDFTIFDEKVAYKESVKKSESSKGQKALGQYKAKVEKIKIL